MNSFYACIFLFAGLQAVVATQPQRIIAIIHGSAVQVAKVGHTIRYICSGQSEDNDTISIKWEKENSQLPSDRSYVHTSGALIIRNVQIPDSGTYVCQVSDGVNMAIQKLDLTVEEFCVPRLSPPSPTILPLDWVGESGNTVRLVCSIPVIAARITWTRIGTTQLPISATVQDGVLTIPNASPSDSGFFICTATICCDVKTSAIASVSIHPADCKGRFTGKAEVQAEGNSNAPPSLIINPGNWTGESGETIRQECTVPKDAGFTRTRLTWKRSGHVPLPASAIEKDGILTIYNPTFSDSGFYICVMITSEGVETNSTISITIHPPEVRSPMIKVEPEWQEVSQGTLAEVKCMVIGDPTPVVTWTKFGKPLGAHVQIVGNTLRIINSQVSDRGSYVCHATNDGGTVQSSALIEINRREMPTIELWPQENRMVPIDGSGILQCRVTAGVPTPSVSWTREDGRPFSSNFRQLPAGVLRFNHVTLDDAGTYICTASNEVGSNSLPYNLEISTPPVISITPSDRDLLSVTLGEKVRLICTASGQPEPLVMWTKHKTDVYQDGSDPETLLPVAVYEINSVSYEDEGTYTCIATNDHSPVEERIQIRVEDGWAGQAEWTPSPNSSSNGGITIPEQIRRILVGGRGNQTVEVQDFIGRPMIGNNDSSIPITSPVLGDAHCHGDQTIRCRDSSRCFGDIQKCDGVQDCDDNTDEEGCPSSDCEIGEFACDVSRCIRNDHLCNFVQDCEDGTDEVDCPTPIAPELNLRTYPSDQNVTENGEVVFTCRDEGARRVKVHWVREDSMPLSPGSISEKGRLMIPNVHVNDSGNYVCEALGVPENEPGRRVIAHLNVEKREDLTFELKPACEFDEATCSNGDCMTKTKVCDGRCDCIDCIDESRCGDDRCEPNEFRCGNKGCVMKIWRCDGDKDCLDGSDEENCEPPAPGSPCKYNEFKCATGDQCIGKSFHCDKEIDCFDGSDELGCAIVQILIPPPRMVILNVGETFFINCTAFGVPIPEVYWRFNIGHTPSKCTTTSINGTGTLICPSITIEDQGAYSCEGINRLGWESAKLDTILRVES